MSVICVGNGHEFINVPGRFWENGKKTIAAAFSRTVLVSKCELRTTAETEVGKKDICQTQVEVILKSFAPFIFKAAATTN